MSKSEPHLQVVLLIALDVVPRIGILILDGYLRAMPQNQCRRICLFCELRFGIDCFEHEPACSHAIFFSSIAKRELVEISLQIIVASYCTISGDYNELFVFGPAETFYRALVPVDSSD